MWSSYAWSRGVGEGPRGGPDGYKILRKPLKLKKNENILVQLGIDLEDAVHLLDILI